MQEEEDNSKTLKPPYESKDKCQERDNISSDIELHTQEIKSSWKLNSFFKGLLEHLRQSWTRSQNEEGNVSGFVMDETPASKRKIQLREKEFERGLFKGLQIFKYFQGQHVYKLGDQKKGLFVVWKGEIECRIQTNLVIVKSGQYFGEKEAILNVQRCSTAICQQDSVILSFSSEVFEIYISNYLKSLNPILKVMDEGMPRSVLSAFLTRSNLIHLATFSRQLTYVYGSHVYLQKDPADCFYFLAAGTISFLQSLPTLSAKSVKQTVQVSILEANDVFGEEALINAKEDSQKMAALGIVRTMTAQVVSDIAIVYQITFEQYLRYVFMRYSEREFESLLKDIISNKLVWYKNRVQSVIQFEQKAQINKNIANQDQNENNKTDYLMQCINNNKKIIQKQQEQRSQSPQTKYLQIQVNQAALKEPKKLNATKNLLGQMTLYDSPEKRKKFLHLTEKRFDFCSKYSDNFENTNHNSHKQSLQGEEIYSINHFNQDSTVQHCIDRLQQKHPTQYITRRAQSTGKQRICVTSPSRSRQSQQLSFNCLESSKQNNSVDDTNIELINLLKTPLIHEKNERLFENTSINSRQQQANKIILRTKTEEDSLLIKKNIQNEQNSQLYCLESMNRQQEKLIVSKVLFRKLQIRDFHFKDQETTARRPNSQENGDKSHRIAVDILANYFQKSQQKQFKGQKNTENHLQNEAMNRNQHRQQVISSKNSLITFYRSPAKSQTALKSRPFRSQSQQIKQNNQILF